MFPRWILTSTPSRPHIIRMSTLRVDYHRCHCSPIRIEQWHTHSHYAERAPISESSGQGILKTTRVVICSGYGSDTQQPRSTVDLKRLGGQRGTRHRMRYTMSIQADSIKLYLLTADIEIGATSSYQARSCSIWCYTGHHDP